MSQQAPLLVIGDALAVRVTSGASDDDAAAALHVATGCADIIVTRRPSGRPRLNPPYAELGVSIAKRDDWRVAAFAPASRVGVDVEIDDPTLDVAVLAADFFAPAEAAWIMAWPLDQRMDAFLRLWCCKEALLKITGRGVYDGMRDPDLSAIAAGLRIDGAVHVVAAASDRGTCHVAVRRIGSCLIALAVER